MRLVFLMIVLAFPSGPVRHGALRALDGRADVVLAGQLGRRRHVVAAQRAHRVPRTTVAAMHGEQPLLRGLLDSGRKVLAGLLFILPGVCPTCSRSAAAAADQPARRLRSRARYGRPVAVSSERNARWRLPAPTESPAVLHPIEQRRAATCAARRRPTASSRRRSGSSAATATVPSTGRSASSPRKLSGSRVNSTMKRKRCRSRSGTAPTPRPSAAAARVPPQHHEQQRCPRARTRRAATGGAAALSTCGNTIAHGTSVTRPHELAVDEVAEAPRARARAGTSGATKSVTSSQRLWRSSREDATARSARRGSRRGSSCRLATPGRSRAGARGSTPACRTARSRGARRGSRRTRRRTACRRRRADASR